MLEVFGYQLRKPLVLGVSPEVSIEPVKTVRRRSAYCLPQDGLIWVQDTELGQKLFSLAPGLIRGEKGSLADQRACHAGNKLDDCLVRKT